MTSLDEREDAVAELARRAALAASEKRRRQRENGTDAETIDVDGDHVKALAPVLERIASSGDVVGIKLVRGAGALAIAALSDPSSDSDVDHVLSSTASSLAHQAELVGDAELGGVRDALISFDRGAILCRWIDRDLLVVAVSGRPPDVGDIWKTLRAEAKQIEKICATISL